MMMTTRRFKTAKRERVIPGKNWTDQFPNVIKKGRTGHSKGKTIPLLIVHI